MTQSKKNDNDSTFTIDVGDLKLDDVIDMDDDTITINLDDTYSTTTTYWAGDSVTDIVLDNGATGAFTIDTSTTDTIDIGDWKLSGDFGIIDNSIDPKKVERMIKHYPALRKVWENFNSVYEMCKQDYEGKIKAGEIDEFDDDIPF